VERQAIQLGATAGTMEFAIRLAEGIVECCQFLRDGRFLRTTAVRETDGPVENRFAAGNASHVH
jgi:hypothetical protein